MSEKRKNPYNVQGISFESEQLLAEAKQRAKSLGLSFSNYVCQLVRNDLQDAGDIVIRPDNRVPFGVNDAPNSSPAEKDLKPRFQKGIARGLNYVRRTRSAKPDARKTEPRGSSPQQKDPQNP